LLERQFVPGGGYGYGPYHPPFPPHFPRRRFIPFFFLFPFFSPGFPFRDDDERSGSTFIHHHAREGETLDRLAQTYNCPRPILEAMNPHIPHPSALSPGMVVYVPRLDKMVCHRMYMEQEEHEGAALQPGYAWPMTGAFAGGVPAYPGL